MLGIGLHSYGFMDAAFKWLLMFIVGQLLLIGDGLLPRSCWQSYAAANGSFGTSVRWSAIVLNLAVMLIGFFQGYNSTPCIAALLVFFAFVATLWLSASAAAPTAPVSAPKGGKNVPAAPAA
jgi:hypothetical protein